MPLHLTEQQRRGKSMRTLKILLGTVLVFASILSSCSRQQTNPSRPDCRIGIVMPTTGEMAPYGAEGVIAARIALEHARQTNKRCQPVLFEQDSASDPNQANVAAATLLSPPKSVQVLVGEINSADTAAMVSQARAAAVPIIAPTASAISLTSMSGQVFRIWPSDSYEAKKMKEHILSQGIKRVAVLYIQLPYGEEMAQYFEQEFKSSGGEVVLESYPKGILDFKPLLQRFQGVDSIYLISYVEDAVLILKQAYELRASTGHQFRFFGTSVLDSPKLVEKTGVGADGLTFAVVQPGNNGDEAARSRFTAEYKAARSAETDRALQAAAVEPTFASFHVYDAVSLAFSSADAATTQGPPSGEMIRNYLRSMPTMVGVTGKIQFDPKGDLTADRTVVFKIIKGGVITPMEKK
jgi:branched-chain amino acid transport system substrate-binding protein